MSVNAINSNKCKFINYVQLRPTEEFLEFITKQGFPFEQFKQACQLVAESHNRQWRFPDRERKEIQIGSTFVILFNQRFILHVLYEF